MSFYIFRITQKKLQAHHKKGIAISAIIYHASAGTYNTDPIGLLDLLYHIDGIACFPAEPGKLGHHQVINIPIVLFYEVE
ncbi:MAG: hypothetical protein ABI675_19635 [Chitinophagaceae bacterium]